MRDILYLFFNLIGMFFTYYLFNSLLLDEPIESTKKLEDINVKIADFGLSRVNDTDMMTGILGTFVYFLMI